MSVVLYAVLAYGAMAALSFGVVAVIVLINRIFTTPEKGGDDRG